MVFKGTKDNLQLGMHKFLNVCNTFCCQAIQSITGPRNNMPHYHSDACKTPQRREKKNERERDKKAQRTRHPCSCLASKRERERGRERERERETQGAGPTRCSSSQLHSREVTMASDKQSTIDHSSPRRSPALEAAEGRAVRQTEKEKQTETEDDRELTAYMHLPLCYPLMLHF